MTFAACIGPIASDEQLEAYLAEIDRLLGEGPLPPEDEARLEARIDALADAVWAYQRAAIEAEESHSTEGH